ncbi:ATP-binding protein [Ralstonia sp. UBA689]|uniref:ATP-binding protein n=1 Tax=Ralstonia sp. UBA689 TaxID=1947373 RepID=UPI0025E44F1E|nr:ATP-binding protein [Ralstonia sp. UBA689]
MLRSLQARLAVMLALGLAALSLVAAFAAFHVLREEIDRISDSALQETAQRLLPLAVMEIVARDEQSRNEQRIPAVRTHHELLTYIVRDQTGKTILQSHDANPAIFPPNPASGFMSTASHRLYSETVLQGTMSIVVAEPLAARRDATIMAALSVVRPLALLVPFALLGAWLIVRFGLRPIRRFCDDIAARGRDDLSPLVDAGMPTEIIPIADSVNDLMQRLDRALTAERSFTASSAHELRTPIAAALAQTQRLIAESQGTSIEVRARNVETSLHTLARLSEKLMQLARAEGGRVLADTPADLRPILQIVVDDIHRAERSSVVQLALPQEPVLSQIDPDAFSILVRNLLENALKHGTRAEAVQVELSAEGRLTVTNRSPVVPADTLSRLIQPFERGVTTAKGSGLGLAIVHAITQAAGARLCLRSPAEGMADGFQAIVDGLATGA